MICPFVSTDYDQVMALWSGTEGLTLSCFPQLNPV
jgi:hypothetical protein